MAKNVSDSDYSDASDTEYTGGVPDFFENIHPGTRNLPNFSTVVDAPDASESSDEERPRSPVRRGEKVSPPKASIYRRRSIHDRAEMASTSKRSRRYAPGDVGGGPSAPTPMSGVQSGRSGGSGGKTEMGASSTPIPLARNQNQRTIDKRRLKFSGTTWVVASNDGTADNVWSKFPWEFPSLFLRAENVLEINASHLFWKADHIHVEFKNPQCVQNIGTNTAGIVQTGVNTQAQLFGYVDNNYLNGIDVWPCQGNATTQQTPAQLTTLVDSWSNHGYAGAAVTRLPTNVVDRSLFTSSIPDCKEIGMGGGQKFDFGWNIHSPYWRETQSLRSTSGVLTTAVENGATRWDEYMGIVGRWTPMNSAAGEILIETTPSNHNAGSTLVSSGVGATTANALDTSCPYMCPDPIPGIYLQLQPQLASLEAGTGDSVCQLQFEIELDLSLTGRIPRDLTQTAFTNNSTTGTYATARIQSGRIPLFRSVLPDASLIINL